VSRYEAGLNSRGSNVPTYPTKAAALKAAKACAREHPGQLVVYFERIERTGFDAVETRRMFLSDETGRVMEV
jgi:hypothetical protein